MALAADYHHTHNLNFLSTGYQAKISHQQNLQLFPTLLEAMELGHLALEESVLRQKASADIEFYAYFT